MKKNCKPIARAIVQKLDTMIAPIDVQSRLLVVREQPVLVDVDVAQLYGVETRRVNEAVHNNPDKFPQGYMFELTADERDDLRSKISTTKVSSKSRALPKAFTEKGLYMLATILKSPKAVATTFAIIETFTQVRSLKRDLLDLNKPETKNKPSLMPRSSDTHRIMKNTLMLYIRMGFIMLVNLFLIRLVMEQLGVEDFGIYNVIAGVVALCSFLSNSMASATQRFFSFALGWRDPDLLAKTYSTNLLICRVQLNLEKVR